MHLPRTVSAVLIFLLLCAVVIFPLLALARRQVMLH